MTAALGNTWSHAVNTRLVVQYVDEKFRQVELEKLFSLARSFLMFLFNRNKRNLGEVVLLKQSILHSFVFLSLCRTRF